MRAICVLLIIGIVSLAVPAGSDDFAADVRLRKAVTLRLHTALLSEAVQEIGRQVGVDFRVDDALSEHKVTLFITGKPAWQVLKRLTDLLGILPATDAQGYVLKPDPKLARMERNLLEWERNTLSRALERTLRLWAQRTGEDFLGMTERARRLEDQMEALEREKPAEWQDRRVALAERLAFIGRVTRLEVYLLGWLYRRLPQSTWAPLWRGETLWFSFPRDQQSLPLPPQVLEWYAGYRGEEVRSVRLGVQWNVRRSDLIVSLLAVPEGADQPRVEQFVVMIEAEQNVSHPLLARWEKWHTSPEALSNNSALQREVRGVRNTVAPRFGRATVADWFQEVATGSGIQVVADAFRLPLSFSSMSVSPGTLAERLQEFALRQPGYLRVEGEWVLFRHAGYWRWLQSEPPEQLCREMERKETEIGLSLDDYARFAASLSPDAVERIAQRELSALFDLAPLQSAMPALRFWNSLTEDQKQVALNRKPLSYLHLDHRQQRLFLEAVAEFALSGADETQMAFFMERWTAPGYTLSGDRVSITAESAEEAQQQQHLVPDAAAISASATLGEVTFYFGYDAGRSVRYSLSLRKKFSEYSSPLQEKQEPVQKLF